MIETKSKPKTKPKKTIAKTEEDLQARYGQSNNPVVKALLAARLEHLQIYGSYFTTDEFLNYWGDASIDEIYNRVENWKANQLK